MIDVIQTRRSIRKFKSNSIPQESIEVILRAGIAAPSSKNRQPWKFIVCTGEAKSAALDAMQHGLERERYEPLLPESANYLSSAQNTLKIMKQAPVVIFIINRLGIQLDKPLTAEGRIYEICNAQSIGAAIENMSLTAAELGLGSLWICDTYFAHFELTKWLSTDGELTAALAVGYADESPSARPRKDICEVVEWRE